MSRFFGLLLIFFAAAAPLLVSAGSTLLGKSRFPCADVECGHISCPHPLSPATDGTCCPVCIDREGALHEKLMSTWENANPDSTARNCRGAYCPPLTCLSTQKKVKLRPGRCCETCHPAVDSGMLADYLNENYDDYALGSR